MGDFILNNFDSFFKYLNERPLMLKVIDTLLVLIVTFGIGTTYILATNFGELFLNEKQIEYQKFINAVETNKHISNILTELRVATDASRVGIFQFHNGTLGIGAIPFFYYSQTFESIAPGVSSELTNAQRISVSIDPDIIELKDKMFMYDTSIDYSSALGHILASRGVTQFYRHALYTLDGSFVGFIMVEYTNSSRANVEELKELLSRYSGAISGLISDK